MSAFNRLDDAPTPAPVPGRSAIAWMAAHVAARDAYTREHRPENWARSRPWLRLQSAVSDMVAMRSEHRHPWVNQYARDPDPPTPVEIIDMRTSLDDVRTAHAMALVERWGYDGPATVSRIGLIPVPVAADIGRRRTAAWLAENADLIERRRAVGLHCPPDHPERS